MHGVLVEAAAAAVAVCEALGVCCSMFHLQLLQQLSSIDQGSYILSSSNSSAAVLLQLHCQSSALPAAYMNLSW